MSDFLYCARDDCDAPVPFGQRWCPDHEDCPCDPAQWACRLVGCPRRMEAMVHNCSSVREDS